MSQSPYTDLERPPLSQRALRRALVVPNGLWTDVRVVAETGSTNSDLAKAARDGAPEGLVLVAERQTTGRGRLGRLWTSPPRAGLTLSVLLRPVGVDITRFGWLPLLAGVALTEAVRRIAEVDAVLKWPNDLLVDERKCAGILAEAIPPPAGPAVVIGVGLNTTLREHELPRPDATSLALAGAVCADRAPILHAFLRSLAAWYERWRDAGGDPDASGLREAYAFHCATLGREVLVHLPDGSQVRGRADGVDIDGRIVVESQAFAAADVVHLR
ncbi:biotin--[acetyl-CoA-carboxylase] ligase [Planosporangium flavigriseum]|uniref:Biotin--[acetyl-CoA-carboxylase] ligase n=1 Tax=Planosporangium flavigriseum TaxID=373681 RepID=A0A8J3PLS1_9ACTN|nr:biotin--[acetyl-CoA-carboxylase] ligase [Planosporangium flavigriseum]NJC63465.1 biotin--[acetyl-CoA-carboxylase] ligase [Planosporangium flavigriseum]GIG72161.1 biotin--[acetyl-CoA-carboxylase] ligase [Planosporangium flavigriseum]